MLVYNYFPKKDKLGIFSGLLYDLRLFRVKAKEQARDARDEESKLYFTALQSTFKILINSFYGYLGFQMGHFNDFEAANQVTAKGRELIQSVVAWLKERSARIIEVDTDGIYFIAPESVSNPAEEECLIANLREILPKGIDLELDGRYPAMFSYKNEELRLVGRERRAPDQRLGAALPGIGIIPARLAGRDAGFASEGRKGKGFGSLSALSRRSRTPPQGRHLAGKNRNAARFPGKLSNQGENKKTQRGGALRISFEITAAVSARRSDFLLRHRN